MYYETRLWQPFHNTRIHPIFGMLKDLYNVTGKQGCCFPGLVMCEEVISSLLLIICRADYCPSPRDIFIHVKGLT